MVVTVTLNPLLERRIAYPSVNLHSVNRNGNLSVQAGGKGINVSRQLNCLGIQNIALTFLGGHNGKLLREALEKERINFSWIKTSAENREASVIIDEEKLKTHSFFSADQVITAAEAEEFMQKLDKTIRNCEIVIFSGSSPSRQADQIFPYGIETANKYDKISICDTYGPHLKDCIDMSPTILHNNVRELEQSLNATLSSGKELSELLDHFYSKGIKQAYITNGASDTFASNFDFHFRVKNAEVKEADPAGSGDSFTSGVAYGWHKDLSFEQTLMLASALGSLNACTLETSKVKFEEIEQIKSRIKIFPLGKKMKLIDVTPS